MEQYFPFILLILAVLKFTVVLLILRYMPRRLLFHDFGAAGRAERPEMAPGGGGRRRPPQ